MNRKVMSVLLLIALVSAFVLLPATASAQAPGSGVQIPITGTLPGGTFSGVATITRFASQGGQLVAIGTLTGTLRDTTGTVIGTVTNVPITLPVGITATCNVLTLELGPLDLNLLGLVVHLDKVFLTVDADTAGGLLGQLLAILCSTNPSNLLVNLLNQLLRLGRL